MIALKLADIKLESSEATLLNLGEICRGISELFTFFCKNEVFNRGRYINVSLRARKSMTFS